MRSYETLFSLLLFCITGPVASGQSPSFGAEIDLTRTRVKYGEEFSLRTAIRNLSTVDESIEVYPCTYPRQWVADNSVVHVEDVACKQNSLAVIRLRPGEAYERSIPVHIELPPAESKSRSVTFRLGYGTKTSNGVWKPWPKIQPIWSNAVTVVATGRLGYENWSDQRK